MVATSCGFESRHRHHVGASFVSLAPIFLQKSERTHAAAPPFQPRPAYAGLVSDDENGSDLNCLTSSEAGYPLKGAPVFDFAGREPGLEEVFLLPQGRVLFYDARFTNRNNSYMTGKLICRGTNPPFRKNALTSSQTRISSRITTSPVTSATICSCVI